MKKTFILLFFITLFLQSNSIAEYNWYNTDWVYLNETKLLEETRCFCDYEVSFDIKILSSETAYRSIFHISKTGDNYGQKWSRIPGIWINKDGD